MNSGSVRLLLPTLLLLCRTLAAQEPIKVEPAQMLGHRLGSLGVIRSEEKLSYPERDYVELQVVVDADGNVESSQALNGPQQFFAEAEKIEAKRKFKPFQQDGEAVRATFQDAVQIVPAEKWADTRVPFPEIKDWNSIRIGLKRSSCYGPCPIYSVEVRGDGEVDYIGENYVLITGHHHGRISKPAVRNLVTAFQRSDYFSLKHRYETPITDCPTFTTSIEFDEQKKSVVDYVGLKAGMPEVVEGVETAIDELTGTDKWVKGNDQTGPALLAEKWDFAANTEENRALFANVIAHQNRELIELFVQHGAPALNVSPEGEGPLVSASANGDLDLVKQLLGSTTKLPERLSSCALAAGAGSGNLALVQFLIERGADPSGPCSNRYGLTVLMRAVQSGKPEMVQEILKVRPDVNAKDFNGDTALALVPDEPSAKDDPPKIINLLIAAGADVNSFNNEGKTPIFKACYTGPDAIRALAKAGANLNIKDQYGQTPLMSCFGNPSVQAMIEAGADLIVRSSNGLTAAEEARKLGATDKAEFLESAMKMRAK